MREIRSLIWKEWHETRLFLWIAWGLFIGLPIIGGFEGRAMYAHRFEFAASPWIIFCAPLMAIVMGVACTCRDLHAKLEDFWQSRPMGSVRLFIVKYVVGLIVILLACAVPLLIELFSSRDNSAAKTLLFLSFLWMAIFSTAFACGCIFRRTAHAASVAVLAVLLVYFVPVVFPPLQRFGADRVLDFDVANRWMWDNAWRSPLFDMAAGCLALSLLAGLIALAAVRFHWHIESERPLIYAAAGAAFLILIESASYQLGTNLPVLNSVDLPPRAYFRDLSMTGSSGAAITDLRLAGWSFRLQPFDVSSNQIKLGPAHDISPDQINQLPQFSDARSERNPCVAYVVNDDKRVNDDESINTLEVFSDATGTPSIQGAPIELWRDNFATGYTFAYARVWHDRLYILGQRKAVIVFDISDPLHPIRLSEEPIEWTARLSVLGDENPTIDLPPAPGMPAIERLKFAVAIYDRAFGGRDSAFDGTIWCRYLKEASGGGWIDKELEAVRLKSLSDDAAHFEMFAKYEPSVVQSMFGGDYAISLKLKDGLLYDLHYKNLRVFDLTGSKPLRLIAHFAAPSIRLIQPLDDGRAIAAGDTLWLLGPPPGR